jgi:hypothetical protein
MGAIRSVNAMKITVFIVIVFAGLVTLLAVSRSFGGDPSIRLAEHDITLEIYDKGDLQTSVQLSRRAQALKRLDTLLQGKKGKWKSSQVSFAPVLLLRAKSFTVNFQWNRIIVNLTDERGSPVQVLTTLSKEEWSDVRAVLTNASGLGKRDPE